MKDVKELDIWRKGIDLGKAVYEATGRFPEAERFGLTSQMQMAAVAVPCNIAEGRGRATRRDYRQFVIVARGSASELETQVIIAAEVGFLLRDRADVLLDQVREVSRMLNGLARALGEPPPAGKPPP
jgi:four helix bundle protein